MSSIQINPPYPTYTDIDGAPLQGGYIYVGVYGLEPTTNPISVYWDAALSIPASQPVRTINGYPSNSGAVGKLYAATEYSIRVNNKKGSLVYSSLVPKESSAEYVFSTVALAKAEISLATGDIVQTLGYYAAGDGGGGQYKVVSSTPGSLGTINHLCSNGLWLSLQHNGSMNLRQAGAKGDGDLDLSGIDASPTYTGTDDTAAIQAVLDLVIARTVKDVTAPVGIFNFTTLKFYDAANLSGTRGGFRFFGSGRSKPIRLSTQVQSGGTVFKGVSLTSSFDVNTGTETATALNTNSSMNNIDMGYFSVIGVPNSGVNLVNLDLITNHSDIGHISIYNKGAGRTLYVRSAYTSDIHHIDTYGAALASVVSGSYGLFYDTTKGTGGMVNINNCTFSGFDTCGYIGETSLDASYEYGGAPVLNTVQFNNGNTLLNVGKIQEDVTSTGQGVVTLQNCYMELPTLNSGVCIKVRRCASITVDGGVIFGNGTTEMIKVSEEYTDTATTAPTRSSQAGTIRINNIKSNINIGAKFVSLPDNSWYNVVVDGLYGRIYDSSNPYIVYVLDTTDFFGTVLLNNIYMTGFNASNAWYLNKRQYLHPASNISAAIEYNLLTTATFTATNRPYLPKIIRAVGGTTTTVVLPAATNMIANTGVAILGGVETLVNKYTTGNLVISCANNADQKISWGGTTGYSLAIASTYIGQIRIVTNVQTTGSTVSVTYYVSQDPLFAAGASMDTTTVNYGTLTS